MRLTIGQRVKRHRTERGLSQMELAEGICSHQTVSLLETDKHTPSVQIMRRLAEKLEIPLHEMMCDRERELEVKLQVEILKVYVEQSEYDRGLLLLDELEQRQDLTDYHKTQLLLLRSECWMRTNCAQEAIELLTNIKSSLETTRQGDHRFLAEFHNKLGNAYYFASNMIYAHMNYMRALEECEKVPELFLVLAEIRFNLGTVCSWLGFYTDAQSYLTESLETFTRIADTKRLASAYFSLGVLYKNLSRYEDAESYLLQALTLYRAHNVVEMANVVRQQFAHSILAKKDPDRAIAELLDCLEEFQSYGDDKRVIHTYARIASLYIDEKRLEDAARYLELGMERAANTKFQTDPRYVYLYQVFAKFSLCDQEFERAIEYSLLASKWYERLGLQRESADSLQICAEAYRRLGSVEEAFVALEKVADALRRAQEIQYSLNGRNFH